MSPSIGVQKINIYKVLYRHVKFVFQSDSLSWDSKNQTRFNRHPFSIFLIQFLQEEERSQKIENLNTEEPSDWKIISS